MSQFLLRQVEEFHHDAGPPLRVRRRPGRLCSFGDGNRVLDLGVFGEGNLGLNLAGIGVEYVAEPPRSSLRFFAADEVADLTHEVSPLDVKWRAAFAALLCRLFPQRSRGEPTALRPSSPFIQWSIAADFLVKRATRTAGYQR